MKIELRTLITNVRLRGLLRDHSLPTSGNKDQLTYRIGMLAGGDWHERYTPREQTLIGNCLGCVRTWRDATIEGAKA